MARSSSPRICSVRFLTLTLLIASAAVLRLVPHPPNFTPIGGMALFAGAHFTGLVPALAVPLLAMLLSDVALQCATGTGFHAGMPVVYLCFAVTVLMGRFLKDRRRPFPVVGMAIGSATLFFAVTNLSVWAFENFYPKDLAGLLQCYVAALPFYGNTIAGNLVTAAVLFGGFSLAEWRWPVLNVRAATEIRT